MLLLKHFRGRGAFFNPRILSGVVLSLAAIGLGVFAWASSPIVITVNTLSDETTPGDGLCSLREAITNANDNAQTYPECAAGSGANAITFSVSGTITLGSTLPNINDDLTIDGGGQSITVSGNNSVQVLAVNTGKTLSLHNLTIVNGYSPNYGGGIYNQSGTVNVTNSTFSGNTAPGPGLIGSPGGGGGIYNNGNGATVNVTHSTFSGNSASFGGGISNNGGTVNVTQSTFSGNTASFSAGGIYNLPGSTLNVTNSTFSGNSASNTGGGILSNGGTVNVTNGTFSGNSASNSGGGISNRIGTAKLKNTIIANSTSGGNCFNTGGGTITADSDNLADDNTCGGATVTTSAQINLQPLATNGGPTQTMALGPGSVAIDAGDETVCAVPPVNEFDQRGVARPFDGDSDGIAVCDTGAYEVAPPPCDNNPPNITAPSNITTEAQKKKVNGQKGAFVSFSVSAFDNEDGPVTATANPTSGTFFPVGITTVVVTATDHCNNCAVETFTVTVKKK